MATAKSGVLFFGLSALATAQQNLKHVEFFEARVRPILVNHCYSCHTDNKLGGLRVDSRSALLEGGNRGGAIVPGKPNASLLIKAVLQTDEKLKMPLAGGKLKDQEIADLRVLDSDRGAVAGHGKECSAARIRVQRLQNPAGTAKFLVVSIAEEDATARS